MILYALYRIGEFLALGLPVRVSYAMACALADLFSAVSRRDRDAVIDNIRIVAAGNADEKQIKKMARRVFRNFAKYLVDFFRFSLYDENYVKRSVRVDGLDNVDKALARGKGVIALSAHIGNWELGGHVLSMLRQPLYAVVMTHQNRKINDFFTKQRTIANMKPIEIGIGLRACYNALKSNGLLAVLGDRDFSKKGIYTDFFGKQALIPKGPAVLSYRTGAAIVPTFMIRQEDDTFRFFFEEPIIPDTDGIEEVVIEGLAKKYSQVIESYVRRYPTQWYMFRRVWNDGSDEDMRPDTIL